MLNTAALFAAFLARAAALRALSITPKVAAVVPVFPPHFQLLSNFMVQWQACEEGREAMDVFVIFSNPQDQAKFRRVFCAAANQEDCDRPYEELLITPSQVPQRAYKSWKKIDGVAQLLQRPGAPYEFALMMDAEIQVSSCSGFSSLLPMLRKKHAAKTVYGMSNDAPIVGRLMSRAACALSPPSIEGANLVRHACNSEVMDGLRSKLKDFHVYTWWNDVPYMQMDVARRMFDTWAAALDAAGFGKKRSTWAAAAEAVLPSPEEVSAAMGIAPGAASEVNTAMSAFEHIIYQLFTVVYEGFRVVDLHERTLPHANLISPGEGFCSISAEEQAAYARVVEPLWQAHGCNLYKMPYGYPLLRFHMNRGR